MLNNKYDILVLGESYLSYIYSIIHAKNDRTVLLLDDDRVEYGKNWYLYFGDLERELLESWGDKYGIKVLQNIDQYISHSPTTVCIQDRIINIGDEPYKNAREFLRKFTDCFSEKLLDDFKDLDESQFNEDFSSFLKELAEASFDVPSLGKIDDSMFLQNKEGKSREFFNGFVDAWKEHSHDGELSSIYWHLIYVLQSLFQTVLQNGVSSCTYRYLILQAFSKRYVIDEVRLMEELKKELTDAGGDFKKTSIEYWATYKNNLCHVLLSSYDGVVAPTKIEYMGGVHFEIPLKIAGERKVYTSFDIVIDYPSEVFANHVGRQMIYSSHHDLGTDFPLWQAEFAIPTQCRLKYLYPKIDGSKISFYQEKVMSDVFEDFASIIPGIDREIFRHSMVINQGKDEWVEAANEGVNLHRNKPLLGTHCRIIDASTPEDGDRLENIRYWGPLKGDPLGLYGFLIDLRSGFFG